MLDKKIKRMVSENKDRERERLIEKLAKPGHGPHSRGPKTLLRNGKNVRESRESEVLDTARFTKHMDTPGRNS